MFDTISSRHNSSEKKERGKDKGHDGEKSGAKERERRFAQELIYI